MAQRWFVEVAPWFRGCLLLPDTCSLTEEMTQWEGRNHCDWPCHCRVYQAHYSTPYRGLLPRFEVHQSWSWHACKGGWGLARRCWKLGHFVGRACQLHPEAVSGCQQLCQDQSVFSWQISRKRRESLRYKLRGLIAMSWRACLEGGNWDEIQEKGPITFNSRWKMSSAEPQRVLLLSLRW